MGLVTEWQSSKQIGELFDGEIGSIEDRGKRSGSQTAMSGNGDLCVRFIANQNNVASALPMNAEIRTSKRGNHLREGKLSWEFTHRPTTVNSTTSRAASVGTGRPCSIKVSI